MAACAAPSTTDVDGEAQHLGGAHIRDSRSGRAERQRIRRKTTTRERARHRRGRDVPSTCQS